MKKITTFILCFVFWLVLAWRLDWEDLLAGLIISGFAAFLLGGLEKSHSKIRPLRFLLFFLKTLWLWTESAFTQVYISVIPSDIKSENFDVELDVSDEQSRAFLVIALNLSPGIIVLRENENSVTVNAVGRTKESVKNDAEKLEKLVEGLFI